MVAPRPSSAAALPEALTAQILQHVPQQQRLQQCAFACKAWATAAALATVHVQALQADSQAIPAFESWLQKHAGQLESLQLAYSCRNSDERYNLQLPWAKLAKLQRLQLQGFNLQRPTEDDSSSTTPAREGAEAGSSSFGKGTETAAPLLPSLQHLKLTHTTFDSISSLQQLAAGAPGLTSLKTSFISFMQPVFRSSVCSRNSETATQQLAAAIPRLLQQLPRLAVLELLDIPMSAAAMQQLDSMQGLQEVSLEQVDHMPAYDLQHLPSSITQLEFRGNIYGDRFPSYSPSLPPQLPQLAGVLQLKLDGCYIPPTVLGAFTRLQSLNLDHCALLPRNGDEDDEDRSTEGTAALLSALAQMACLQDLELSVEGIDTDFTAPQSFAALTASTQLTRLALCPEFDAPIARGAAQYMFPAGRQLPLLQHVIFHPFIRDEDTEEFEAEEWCIDGADVGRIAACCTGLQGLQLSLVVKPGADLSGLLQLPESCKSLSLSGAAFPDAAASVLVQLPQLEYLYVGESPGFTDAGLLQLAELDLGRLRTYDCGLSEAVGKEGRIDLEWSEEASMQQQVEALCDLSPLCAPAHLKKQKEVNKQLQAEISALRSKLRTSQAQLRRSEAQVQLLQQQREAAQTVGHQG